MYILSHLIIYRPRTPDGTNTPTPSESASWDDDMDINATHADTETVKTYNEENLSEDEATLESRREKLEETGPNSPSCSTPSSPPQLSPPHIFQKHSG